MRARGGNKTELEDRISAAFERREEGNSSGRSDALKKR
jgi:hypothetical protein